jgi:DUF438 domain-containing protein
MTEMNGARQAALKDIILKLHEGLTAEAARDRFEKEVGNVTSTEIAELEQGLLDEGLKPEEIKKFCNVHALIFRSALESVEMAETSPSHPVYLFRAENREIEKLLGALKRARAKKGLTALLTMLRGIATHYERKEQLLFPFLEKKNFTGPSKVMWGKDNEIRDLLKAAIAGLKDTPAEKLDGFREKTLTPLVEEVRGMVFKEENILFPTALEKLDAADWVEILRESEEVGYVFIEKPAEASHLIANLTGAMTEEACVGDGVITFPTGTIRAAEILPLLNALPVDITFVGADDTVKYFSKGTDRIFTRSTSIIGRNVKNCHPPQSLDAVERIIQSFKDGSRDSYEFWLTIKDKFIYIRFYALRDAAGKYLGVIEVAQDVTHVRALEGEKRLLDERD